MTDDWFDLLVEFAAAEVRFLVIGAHALAAHGIPRGTQDLDVWIERSPENAARTWGALARFGAPLTSLDLKVSDLEREDLVVQLGLPPNRIDIMTGISGLPGPAFLHVAGRSTIHDVVFGEPCDLTRLGFRSLGGLNLRIDPARRQLVDAGPVPAAVTAAS